MHSDPISVLVCAIGGSGHGEQILKALRLAKPGSYRIIGGDMSEQCPQFALVDVPVILPRATSPEYIDAILALAKRYDVKAVFHGCEPELKVLSRERARLEAEGILVPINPASVIDVCMDKVLTASFLRQHGFKTPRFEILDGNSDLAAIDFFPVVVKPYRDSGGSQNTFIAQTSRELEIISEYVRATSNSFMVQEYVGDYRKEFTVGVLSDFDGKYINSIAVHRALNSGLNMRTAVRNLTGRKDLGEWLVISSGVSHGYVDRFPEVTEPCERIASALGAKGPINVQCRLVDGEVYVFEINPRFSGTTSLRAMVGYNEPDILLNLHLRGRVPQTRFPYDKGWIIRSLNETLLKDVHIPSWKELVAG